MRLPKLIRADVVRAKTMSPSTSRPRPVATPRRAPTPNTSSGAAWTDSESGTAGVSDIAAAIGRSSAGAMSDDVDRLMTALLRASGRPPGGPDRAMAVPKEAHAEKCFCAGDLSAPARRRPSGYLTKMQDAVTRF